MSGLIDLLRGRQPLRRALLVYALLWGTLINLAGLMAALALFTRGDQDLLAAALYFLPLAYVALAVAGVWRSAARAEVAPREAGRARATVLLWALAMLVI